MLGHPSFSSELFLFLESFQDILLRLTATEGSWLVMWDVYICRSLQSSQTLGTGMLAASCRPCQRGRSSPQSRATTQCRGQSLFLCGERAPSKTCGRGTTSSRMQSALLHPMAQQQQQHHQRWALFPHQSDTCMP